MKALLPVALFLSALTAPVLAQAVNGGAGALGSSGAGMIGGSAAASGTKATGVIALPPQIAPSYAPPVGAGYGTPGGTASLGDASNSGVGAGVQSDIRSGLAKPPSRTP